MPIKNSDQLINISGGRAGKDNIHHNALILYFAFMPSKAVPLDNMCDISRHSVRRARVIVGSEQLKRSEPECVLYHRMFDETPQTVALPKNGGFRHHGEVIDTAGSSAAEKCKSLSRSNPQEITGPLIRRSVSLLAWHRRKSSDTKISESPGHHGSSLLAWHRRKSSAGPRGG